MNDYQLFDSEWVQALGWTLLHSLWQGVVIALLLATVLLIFRKQSANSRYLFGIIALSGLLASMAITFSIIYTPPTEIEPLEDSSKVSNYAFNHHENSLLYVEEYSSTTEDASIFSMAKSYFEEHMPFIMLLYLIGVLILTMRMLGELVYIQNLRHSRSQFVSKVWQQRLKEMAIKMGIKKSIALKESIKVSSPMMVGFLKPIIFVPMSLLANLPSEQIESILAHELAHIRRHDYLINLLQSFVEILLFFNPSVWWISSFIRSEREHCCDDIAIEVTGDELTLARTLANLEEWRIQNSRLAVAFGGKNNSGVLARIQRLLEKKESTQLPFRLFWAVMILSIGLVFTAFSFNEDSISKNNDSESSFEHFNLADDQIYNTSSAIQPEMESLASIDLKSEEELNTISSKINAAETALAVHSSDSENLFENASASQALLMNRDTTPQNIKKLEKERSELEESFQLKREALSKQMRELETKRYAIEKEMQNQDFELQTAQLQLQKEMQNIEKEKMMIEREVELQMHGQQEIIMELQYQMQELELLLDIKQEELHEKENDEKIEKEIAEKRKEIQEIRKAILQHEKEVNRQELEARKSAMMKEKEVQEIMYKNQLKEHENQMKAHSKEGDLLKFEESMRELEMQMTELDYKLQNDLQQLQHKMEKEYHKMENEEY